MVSLFPVNTNLNIACNIFFLHSYKIILCNFQGVELWLDHLAGQGFYQNLYPRVTLWAQASGQLLDILKRSDNLANPLSITFAFKAFFGWKSHKYFHPHLHLLKYPLSLRAWGETEVPFKLSCEVGLPGDLWRPWHLRSTQRPWSHRFAVQPAHQDLV